jgi:hypothetical protein
MTNAVVAVLTTASRRREFGLLRKGCHKNIGLFAFHPTHGFIHLSNANFGY